MRSRARLLAVVVVAALAGAQACDADKSTSSRPQATDQPPGSDGPKDARDALLSTEKVVAMHLRLEAGAMAALAKQPRKYVKAVFRHGTDTLKDVGVRFKGHRTMRDWSGKPAFKLHFGRYVDGRRFKGLRQLILDNMVEDPTMVREALGNYIGRELGIPAPRTGFVELHINGELFGLYTSVEPTDKRFLARHFEDASGPLYEGEYGCDLYPGDVESLELDAGHDPGRTRVLALAKAATGPVNELLDPEAGLVDREAFFRFLAFGTLVGDFDGYRHAHNYRLYFDPKSSRWSLLPVGLDRVLKKRTDPFDHHSLLARKCLADRSCRLDYVKALHRASKRFEGLALEAKLDALSNVVRTAMQRDPRRPHNDKKRNQHLAKTRAFIRERPQALREQLNCWNGKREVDRDEDGHGCDDCDDDNARVAPGAAEVCNNGIDDNCSGLADDSPDCRCTEEEVEGVRFLLCHLPATWEQAAQHCEQRGGHLARIDGRKQSKRLGKKTEKIGDEVWWIGMNDRAREGVLGWHDGSEVSFTYWGSGEPDHYACGQDCAALKQGGGGRWRDLHCAAARPFICRVSGP